MKEKQSVWNSNKVLWEQIKEEQQDYQYFKTYDNNLLAKTLNSIKTSKLAQTQY